MTFNFPIPLGNAIAFAKIMLLERFRNVVQAILAIETTNISGLWPDSQYGVWNMIFAKGSTLMDFRESGRRPEIFVVSVVKIAWTTLRKRSKSMIFAKAIAFPNRIISKISACGGLHSQQCSIYTPPKHRLLKHFSNSQAAIALSTQAQNVF